MKENKKVELLAPAGNKSGFYGAIHAGADAVYLSGNRFGARAYADNFSTEEIVECIYYAHMWGRKVYLTLNTLIKEKEFSQLYEYLAPIYEAGLDAVIIQDMGVFHYIKQMFPDLSLHVSTQMTITSCWGAAFLKELGAERIVPARELSLTEIKKMKESTGLEMECFIHGAMCYSYSGQCLFSSILGGRSGNRGRCAQPCRLPYQIKTSSNLTKECYPLSLKDMFTLDCLPELIDAGIDSFKIEGRMKRPEYTAFVTAIYRKYIDAFYQEHENYTQGVKMKWCPSQEDMKQLSSMYIRSEYQDGYYHKRNGKDMITLQNPSYNKTDEALCQVTKENYVESFPKLRINMDGEFYFGQPGRLTVIYNDQKVVVTGAVVQRAQNQPMTKEGLEKQLRKLGNSAFSLHSLSVNIEEGCYLSIKEINELRREAINEMEKLIIVRNGFPISRELNKQTIDEKDQQNKSRETITLERIKPNCIYNLSIQTKAQLISLASWLFEDGVSENIKEQIQRVDINADLLLDLDKDNTLQQILKKLSKVVPVNICMPYILRENDRDYLNRIYQILCGNPEIITGVVVRSLDGLGFLVQMKYEGNIFGDAGFYAWNRESINAMKKYLKGFCIPLELKESEQYDLLTNQTSFEKIIYGRIPMMITANCLAKTSNKCIMEEHAKQKEDSVLLIDRYHKVFPVSLQCRHCTNIIYNSVPLSLHNSISTWKSKANLRIQFTIETPEEMMDILEFFLKQKNTPPYHEYTTGHEKRGVE